MTNSSVDTYRYRAGPGRCVLWLVWPRCSCGMKSQGWNTQPDALECHSRRKPNTASVTIPRYRQEGREIPRLMVLWGTLWLKWLGGRGGNQFLFFLKKQISNVSSHWLVIPGSKALFSTRLGMGSGCRSVFPLDDSRHRVYWGQIAPAAVPNLPFAGNSPSAAATLSDHRRRCRSPTRLLPSYKGRTKGSATLELKHMYLPCLPCAHVTVVGCRRCCCSCGWWLSVCWCWSRRFVEPFSHQPSSCSRTWCTVFLRRKTTDNCYHGDTAYCYWDCQ